MYISHYLCLHNFIKQSQQPFYTLPLFMDNNNNPTSSSTTTTTTTNNKKKRSSSSTDNKNVVRLSTDPQSVAARERRHRISERFKILQSLVPGGTKMDTVSMLEEAIHYVKFLKTQIWLHQTMINFIDDYGGVGDHPSSSSSTSNHLLFSNTHDHPPQPTLPSLPPSTLPPPPLYFFQGDHQDEQQPMLPNISNNY